MDNFYKIRKRGFTLVELLIAMAVGAVIMAAVYAGLDMAVRLTGSTDRKVITQQDTRAVLDLMAMEIRMASYNPIVDRRTWNGAVLAPGCNGIPLNQNYKGILFANANEIRIAMDLDGSGTIGNVPGGANEYVEYSYDGANTITRNVNCGVATSILGPSIPPDAVLPTSNVRNVEPPVVPLFRYFDKGDVGNPGGYEILPAALPGRIPDIRWIQITIVTDTVGNDTTQTGPLRPRRMIYSTKFMVRNHVVSP